MGSSGHRRSFGSGDVWISTRVSRAPNEVILGEVIFAFNFMSKLISDCRVKRAGFRIVAENSKNNSSLAITRVIHDNSGKTSIIYQVSTESLFEA